MMRKSEWDAWANAEFYCDTCKIYWKKYHSCMMTKNDRKNTDLVRQVNASLV